MACGKDEALRKRIEEMLKVEVSAEDFFKTKAPTPEPRLSPAAAAFGVPPSGGTVAEPAKAGTRALERERAQEGESPSVAELPATNGK